MTVKQRIDQHDREIAEIRALQIVFEKNMIKLVNEQGETKRSIASLSRTVDRFIKSIQSPRNGGRTGK